jgi:hypothetical protein
MPKLLRRRLLWALVVSLALHLLLIFQAEIPLPDWDGSHETISVSLAPVPRPIEPPKPADPEKPPRPPKPRAQPKLKPAPKPELHEAPKPPALQPEPAPAPQPPAEAPSEPEPVTSPPVESPADTLAKIPDEPVTVPPPPRHVEIEFRGANGSKGSGKQTFDRDENNHYRLTGEMSLPVMLFISGSMEEHSEGLITEKGLQPVKFTHKITGSKPQTANFDWDAQNLVMDTGKRTETKPLSPGTQDMLSFMYQFMFVPPLEQMQITMVTGKKLRTYVYNFEGEDTLDTPMGKLKALHIGRSNSDGDERTELWLASEYRYLPIRIRRTEKDGAIVDLVATRLTLTE